MHTIQIKNVKKNYLMGKKVVPALRGVNLSIKKGEFVSIMGTSGCGKSTLLNSMAGIIEIDDGEILVNEKNISAMNDDEISKMRLKHIGYVYQFYNLLPLLSAKDNVKLPLTMNGCTEKEADQIAFTLLEKVKLEDRADHLPSELSGGEQQRVAIARAIANKPTILLLDEPTGDLDGKTGTEIMNLLKDLHNEGNTIVMVTHDKNIASYGTRIIHISDGKIKEE